MPGPSTQLRVAVTGAAGSLGRRVLEQLAGSPAVEHVVALDREQLRSPGAGVDTHVCDVRDQEIGRFFAGCDALIHLAFIVERGSRDAERTAEINVGGTRNVCEAAAASGVGQIVYASSVAAYGFHADNDDVFLSEEAPVRGNEEFYYSRHKAEVERWLDGFEAAHPEIRVARLRPTIFVGEKSKRARALRGRLHAYLTGPSPRAQITHEDDVAAAFVLALERGAQGAFNIAVEDAPRLRDLGHEMGKLSVPIPRPLLRVYAWAYRRGIGDIDPIWLQVGAGHTLLASGEKARRELGWKPRYATTGDVLRQVSGRPNARASRAAKAYLGPLARATRILGALPAGREVRAGSRGLTGSVNLTLTGDRPSSWHFSLRDGRLGAHAGLDPDARATVTMRDSSFTDMLAGRLEPATARLTGKIRLRGDDEMGFVVSGLVGQFRNLRQATGLRGWAARRFARRVLRDAEPAVPTSPPERSSA